VTAAEQAAAGGALLAAAAGGSVPEGPGGNERMDPPPAIPTEPVRSASRARGHPFDLAQPRIEIDVEVALGAFVAGPARR
jgi:hypothetical protein